jgi:hypothetical protein
MMNRTAKKVTVNLPADVLEKAQKITGRGIICAAKSGSSSISTRRVDDPR